jgi:hypothetical protein
MQSADNIGLAASIEQIILLDFASNVIHFCHFVKFLNITLMRLL